MYKLILDDSYLKIIKQKYENSCELWYSTILPKEKADELFDKYKGDYSIIWHEHCSCCWKSIDNLQKKCYFDEEKNEWLCENCYKKINE